MIFRSPSQDSRSQFVRFSTNLSRAFWMARLMRLLIISRQPRLRKSKKVLLLSLSNPLGTVILKAAVQSNRNQLLKFRRLLPGVKTSQVGKLLGFWREMCLPQIVKSLRKNNQDRTVTEENRNVTLKVNKSRALLRINCQ